MNVIAHRSNSKGADKLYENTYASVQYCLEKGWGIEIDIRRSKEGEFYISHDPAEITMQNKAEKFCALIREFPDLTVALNVKELGYEDDLIQFLMHESIIHQVFLFDMELLESVPGKTASLFRELNPNVQIAARVSDRGESIDRALAISYAKIVWADEFETLWITSSIIKELKAAGKLIYVISPEIHGFPLDVAKQRWSQFIEWGVDGICTDYAMELQKLLADNIKVDIK